MDAAHHETSDVIADGEIVWSWRSDAGAKLAKTLTRLADDGGNQAWSPGRSRITRKTIAQGRPDESAEPVVLPRAFFCTRTMGASRRPVFPAPSVRRRDVAMHHPDAIHAAGPRTLAMSSRGECGEAD